MLSLEVILALTVAGAALFSGLVLLVGWYCCRSSDSQVANGKTTTTQKGGKGERGKLIISPDTEQLINKESYLTEQVQPELTGQGDVEKTRSYTDLSVSSARSTEGQWQEKTSGSPAKHTTEGQWQEGTSGSPSKHTRQASSPLAAIGENGSRMSLDKETGSPLGHIQVNIRYEMSKKALRVKIVDAANLPRKGQTGTINPFVKIGLLPGKSKVKTTFKENDNNPVWNEEFTFKGLNFEHLLSKTLHLQVFDRSNFTGDRHIGEVRLSLSQVGISKLSQGVGLWKNLHRFLTDKSNCGELLVSLCYQSTTNKLQLFVIKGKDIWAYGDNIPEAYVKIRMIYRGKNMQMRKSQENIESPNPVFNEPFMFSVQHLKIEDVAIKLTVKDKKRKGQQKLLGILEVGSNSGDAGVQHWNAMCSKPNLPIAQWHELIRPVTEKRLLLDT